jgi:hypothetical protein
MHTYIPEAKQAESSRSFQKKKAESSRTLGPEQTGLAQVAVEAGVKTGTSNGSGDQQCRQWTWT